MIFKLIDNAENGDQVLELLADYYRSHGFAATCIVIPELIEGTGFHVFERGMPAEWMAKYRLHEFARLDPIPEYTMDTGEVLTLTDALQRSNLSSEQKAYVDEFMKSGVTDGLAIPTIGHSGCKGFLGVAQVTKEDLASADASLLQAVAQHAHHKLDRLGVHAGTGKPQLSPREHEILRWIAAGKSNNDIGAILGISLPTVSTYVSRIFMKLRVNDRVSAALVGYKLGLLA